jgi:hypothetical protein
LAEVVPGGAVERALALTHESIMRIKPEIEEPLEIDPVPIPEPPLPHDELLLAVTVEFQIVTPPRIP